MLLQLLQRLQICLTVLWLCAVEVVGIVLGHQNLLMLSLACVHRRQWASLDLSLWEVELRTIVARGLRVDERHLDQLLVEGQSHGRDAS